MNKERERVRERGREEKRGKESKREIKRKSEWVSEKCVYVCERERD